MPSPSRATVLAIVLLAAVISARNAAALALVVDRTDDVATATACTAAPDDCSLRGAIVAANAAAPAASDIAVPAGTYVLTETVTCNYDMVCAPATCARSQDLIALCIDAPVTIHGAGAGATILDGNLFTPIALVSAGAVATLSGVTIAHGRHEAVLVTDRQVGGALLNHGTLHVTDSAIVDNAAVVFGGAIYNAAQLTITRSLVTSNSVLDTFNGEGGGIFGDTGSAATIIDSTISDNNTSANGGGITARQSTLTVSGSTISGNVTTFTDGGGIYTFGPATVVITNSTISGNRAGREGGGLALYPNVEARLQNVTITNNTASEFALGRGGGASVWMGATLKLRNSIVAGNAVVDPGVGPDLGCQVTSITSEGHNLLGNLNNCTVAGDQTGNVTGDPTLGPLGDNGGGTATHALGTNSPAVDRGNPGGCTDDTGAVLTADQRGSTRPVDGDQDGIARCDIGAFETGGGSLLAGIHPTEGGDAGSVLAVIRGGGFEIDAVAKLVREGQPDVVGTETSVGGNGTIVSTRFDLTGTALGAWDVVVENPGGASALLPGGFTVATARAPDLWVEVIGPDAIRARRPTRYLLRYGNRGNTDAFAVPLLFGVSEFIYTRPGFLIAPPPELPGSITILEWGQYYREVVDTGEEPRLETLALILPVVPAGSTGTLEMILFATRETANLPFTLRLEAAEPLFETGPKPAAVARLVQGAHEKSARLFGYTLPTTIDDELTAHVDAQLESVVADGVATYLASGGTEPVTYSLSQLAYDVASLGLVAAQIQAASAALETPDAAVSSEMTIESAADELSCVCGVGPKGLVCCPGCLCPRDDAKDTEEIPKSCLAQLDQIGKPGCKRPSSPAECREIGFEVIRGQDKDGKNVSICTNNRRCLVSNPLGGNPCIRFPVRTVVSYDPNDKTGPIGGGDAHFIRPEVPLAYTIRFENQPTATAPAAEVVITDQLDPARVDLATLTLGPVGFGTSRFVPSPGTASFTGDVDLRPANDLIVRVTGNLAAETGLLTWRFTSLDPDTLEPPTDALAGFLPPNASPPEGDGYVTFTVAAQPGLASGTTITNLANIVFDENDPIVTPMWSNTIDTEPPTSQIVSAAPAGTCSQDLAVTWSGADSASNVAAFTIAAAEDGGPLQTWQATDATSGTFRGKWGASYTFQTIAEDAAGNVEATPAPPSAPVVVPDCGPFDLAVTKIGVRKTAKLKTKRPARRALVKVAIQNRSAHAQSIAAAATLAALVSLSATPLDPACPPAAVTLHDGKPQKPFPLTLGPKKSVAVVFDVLLDCAVDPAKGSGHEDFSLTATVHQHVLGGADAHPDDDACPRAGVKPPPKDAFPDGKIVEKGCGVSRGGVRGGPVLIDVVR